MRINPVLRNEAKITVRNKRFTLMLFFYIVVVSIGVVLYYKSFTSEIYVNGLYMQSTTTLYVLMSIVQAIFLIFMVPSLTSSAISSEREKQTLDILLSTKLTPFQIIIGKLLSSSLKVVMLIICTIPLYGICSLIGGVSIVNILELAGFFIVNTIFVGAIGMLISTYAKTSKVSTTITYFLVLFIYIGILIIAYILFMFSMRNNYMNPNIKVNPIIYLSPVTGFISLLSNQLGARETIFYFFQYSGISSYTEYISIGIQLVLSAIFLYLASVKLNPLKKERVKRKSKKLKE
ncbi:MULTISPECIES: ABC transporter permease [Eubacteriales]|uniref:ABC transporter n=1 Tax=Clostridium isatidis TaxID=182773 RepID=A0A343JDZ0_9CLOT|nr:MULTISPECIES: ABC transporter permease [Eubacteriales]ASW43748.1 ABC transporter [Clostridium isatidis]MBU5454545.1 ABC transporter permease [Caproiciproducens sp. MSJ-32]NLZ35163.1 ABC transporter permease subunit [Clostridiales bacterium]